MYQMKGVGERKVKTGEAVDYLYSVFSSFDKFAIKNTNESAMSRIMALFDCHGRGAEMPSSKGTAFGLLNSVTKVDHELRARSADYRLESAWFGQEAAREKVTGMLG